MTSGIFSTTVGGNVSRAVVYGKLLDHIREAQDCAALLAHLHQTEGNSMDTTLAHGWLGISELMKRMSDTVTKMAMNKLS